MPSGKKKYDITALAYDKRGRLLSVGRNSYVRTHPLQAKMAKKAGKPNAIYIHAELDAMIRARGKIHRLVVLRYHNNGKPANAAPCAICREAIRLFNIKQVEHT